MAGNDACNLVKGDLKAGTWANYTDGPPEIYIENEEEFHAGPIYILLTEGRREPVQSYNGTVIYYERSCTLEIVAPSKTIRDNIYLDIIAIGNATNRGYVFDRSDDEPISKKSFRMIIEVKFIN